MAIPKNLPKSETVDSCTRAALINQAHHEWGSITTDEIRAKIDTPAKRSEFVDRFLDRKDAYVDLPPGSLDRNYLIVQTSLL